MKFNLKIEDINYVKILYKDRFNFTHYMKAAIKKLEEKYIFCIAKTDKKLNIDTPQEVALSFICDNGLYKSKTKLNFVQYDEKEEYVFFSLITPQEVDFQQNREYYRVEMQENATISYVEENETIKVPAKIHDISANGVRLTLKDSMKLPEEVTLSIFFQTREIKSLATLIRTDEDDNLFKASFHFKDLSCQDLDFISRMCLKKQLENRRHSIN